MKKLLIFISIVLLLFTQVQAELNIPPDLLKRPMLKLSYNGTGNAEYIGKSWTKGNVDEEQWQIKKLLYDSSDRVKSIVWASGTDSFQHVWASRTTYTYSEQ